METGTQLCGEILSLFTRKLSDLCSTSLRDSTVILHATLLLGAGKWASNVFFCFFDHEVSSATVSAFSQAGLLSFLRRVNTVSNLR